MKSYIKILEVLSKNRTLNAPQISELTELTINKTRYLLWKLSHGKKTKLVNIEHIKSNKPPYRKAIYSLNEENRDRINSLINKAYAGE